MVQFLILKYGHLTVRKTQWHPSRVHAFILHLFTAFSYMHLLHGIICLNYSPCVEAFLLWPDSAPSPSALHSLHPHSTLC